MSDYIPLELIPNILARLPVDDVLRCTSICKSWYSLITSPSFASSHLNLSSSNQEPRLLVEHYTNENSSVSYCLHRDNQTFDEIAELDPPFHSKWDIIDCLNGLFCLYNEGKVMLWNPSLRKYLILPKPRVLPNSYHHTVGFGFLGTSNEYKILRVSYPTITHSVSEAEVYEQSTGSWRNLNLGDYSCTDLFLQQVHLNGILHWSALNSETGNFICSFDLKNERFSTLMVPSWLRNDDTSLVPFVPFTSRESLLLIDVRKVESCGIWLMKEYGVSESWQKLFVIDRYTGCLITYPRFRHNGELFFGKSCHRTGKTELVSYDCNNDQFKNLGLVSNGSAVGPDSFVYTYVESLLLMNIPKTQIWKN